MNGCAVYFGHCGGYIKVAGRSSVTADNSWSDGANVSGLTSNAKVQSEWLPQCTETFTPCRPMRLTGGLLNGTGSRLPATGIEYRFALPLGRFAYSLPKSSVLAPMGLCDSLKMSRKRTGL